MSVAATTVARVRTIIKTPLKTAVVSAFVDDANLWVNEEIVDAAEADLSDARLELIARYLAAALVRLRDLGLKSTSIQDVTEAYQVDSEVTDYLLRAAGFDPTGRVRLHFLAEAKGTATSDEKTIIAMVGRRFTSSEL